MDSKTPMNYQPKIGIALATYNPCLSFFLDQISSLKNQTYKHWHCVIVDDKSSEEKYHLILDIIAGDPRFEVHRNEVNTGSFKTFERALGLLPEDAELICYCDQDDIWIPTKLEIQVEEFKNPDVYLVHTDQSLIDEKGRAFVASCWALEGRSVLEATTDLLLFRNLITGCTTMFRRRVLDTALPFYPLKPLAVMYHHDMWVAMHACVHGRVLGLNAPLVLYRQHANNVVGVSSLRRNFNFSKLATRASLAFSERVCLREDFLNSWGQADLKVYSDEKKKLSYLDNPLTLGLKGACYVFGHPMFFRTWVMLCVGYFSFHLNKKSILAPEKVL